ncbi:unnamed protein product [Prorocentrum cordatum]|uniref:P-type Ca(2+) transporter n=1 Tax=Prorocentrum cordatum TaxID=2364126 RepID=A0ABN9SUV8_9DINO|nr:unnamed protein product [Polarella glacialis]
MASRFVLPASIDHSRRATSAHGAVQARPCDPGTRRRAFPVRQPGGACSRSYVEGIAIFVIVLLNAGIAAVTENSANDALEKLAKMTAPDSTCIRDGTEKKVKTTAVVPGDMVLLSVGDVVPADMRMLAAADLKVSEMPLTGEPDDVAKKAQVPKKAAAGEEAKLRPENVCYSGCEVKSGNGKGIVIRTAMDTEVGKIAGMMTADNEGGKTCGCLPDTTGNMTPLQESLQRLGVKIGGMAIGVCVFVFIVGLLRQTKDPEDEDKPTWLYMILVSVTLAVAAIPEGIPLCVTISLSFGSTEMQKKQVLVRKLAAVETLGSASIICTDKTGTLTEGKMRTVKLWSAQEFFDIEGSGFVPEGRILNKDNQDAKENPSVRTTLLSCLLNSNARIEKETLPTGGIKWNPVGNSSEAPLVVAAQKIDLTPEKGQKMFPRLFEVPFSSSRKMMLTAHDCSSQTALAGLKLTSGSKVLTVVKGAPDRVLKVCSRWARKDGETEEFTQQMRDEVMSANNSFASEALRVLAIAVAPLQELGFDGADQDIGAEERLEALCKDLTFVGLVANMDPARKGVDQAVLDAIGGHIRVIMITGDYLKTAVAIAKSINILDKNDDESKAVDCGSLRPDGKNYISDEAMDDLTNQMCVFARAQPEDKLQIVKSLQRQKKVSAMTGDGVNDAPALNAADIGVAMGIQGTEVAKGASDMILTDDDFCSIVAAVEKGRVIYSGIQKFVAFIMSVHIAEVMQIFFCVVVGLPMMRQPVQILFLILVTDLPPSVALGMEPGQAGILKEWPRPRSQNIVLMWMWVSIVINGAILSLVIICVYFWALNFYVGFFWQSDMADIKREQDLIVATGGSVPTEETIGHKLMQARTCAFISLVWAENVRSYVSRSFDRPVWVEMFRNGKMQIAICMAQVALYAAIFIPGLSDTILQLNGTIIGWEGWVAAFLGALGCLVLCEFFKLFTGIQKKKFDDEMVAASLREEEKRLAVVKANSAKREQKTPVAETPAPAPAPKEPALSTVIPAQAAEAVEGNGTKVVPQDAKSPNGTTPNGTRKPGGCAGLCMPASALF